MQKITPFLWFDGKAEEAAKFYTSILKNSKITGIARYPEGTPGPAGSVMTVSFELDGQKFLALNGGPQFKFNESISFSERAWSELEELQDTDGAKTKRVGEAMMQMKKLDIAELQRAYAGQ